MLFLIDFEFFFFFFLALPDLSRFCGPDGFLPSDGGETRLIGAASVRDSFATGLGGAVLLFTGVFGSREVPGWREYNNHWCSKLIVIFCRLLVLTDLWPCSRQLTRTRGWNFHQGS